MFSVMSTSIEPPSIIGRLNVRWHLKNPGRLRWCLWIQFILWRHNLMPQCSLLSFKIKYLFRQETLPLAGTNPPSWPYQFASISRWGRIVYRGISHEVLLLLLFLKIRTTRHLTLGCVLFGFRCASLWVSNLWQLTYRRTRPLQSMPLWSHTASGTLVKTVVTWN